MWSKVVKINSNILPKFTYKYLNYCIDRGEFPNELSHAELIPVHKTNCKREKENCRPASIFSNFSNVYENFLHTTNSIIVLKIYLFQVNVALRKVIVHNTVS